MRSVLWNDEAEDDLGGILDYIAARNPAAADRMQTLFNEAVQRLARQPLAYRAGRISGLRELVVHPNYVLVYGVEHDVIRIVNVLHAR